MEFVDQGPEDKPVLVRRPTLTHNDPVTGKRITFMITAHGIELLDYGLDKEGVHVRVFSLAGELGVCTVSSKGSFDREQYYNDVKRELEQTSSEDSTYQLIKVLQNAKREEYKTDIQTSLEIVEQQYRDALEELANLETTLENEGKRLVKDENGEWIENEEIYEQKKFIRDVEKTIGPVKRAEISSMLEQHIRTYEPVINKMYDFREEFSYNDEEYPDGKPVPRFVKVVHYDGQAEDGRYDSLDLTNKESVKSLFSDGGDQDLLEHYQQEHSRSVITLGTIIAISKKLGFTIINIIDLSCRSTEGDSRYIQSTKVEEAEMPIAALVGGRRKRVSKCTRRKCSKKSKSKRRMQKNQKIHRRRSYKRK